MRYTPYILKLPNRKFANVKETCFLPFRCFFHDISAVDPAMVSVTAIFNFF